MFRGGCPVGGVDVKGYNTQAGRYCAIKGGSYAPTARQDSADEQGACTLSSGKVCDASEYYAGKCAAQ
jgi:putative hemolysin